MNIKAIESDRLMFSVYSNGIGGKYTDYMVCVVIDRKKTDGVVYRSFIAKSYSSYDAAHAAGEALVINARSSWEMTVRTIEQIEWIEIEK